MTLKPIIIRGVSKWVLDDGRGKSRTRQFFATKTDGQAALRKAQKDRSELGKSWGVIPEKKKLRWLQIMAEMEANETDIENVWRVWQSSPQPKSGCSLRKAVNELLEAKRSAKRSTKHVGNLEWYLDHFISGRETADVSSITPTVIEKWFAGRNEAPHSQRGHIGLLSSLFAHCWRKRYIAENPVKRLDPVTIVRKPPPMLTLVQSESAMLWAAQHKPAFVPWLALTLFAGLRPESEADAIVWPHIDLDRAVVRVEISKTRHPRILDLQFCPPAWEWLLAFKSQKLPLTHITRRRYLRALREHLEMDRWPQDILRHTAASNLLAYHQDAGKVANFLGHSVGVLLRSYKSLVEKSDAEKWMKILPKQNAA